MRFRMDKTWLAAVAVVIVGIPAAYSMRHRGDDADSVLVFPGGNSRNTYFTLHNVKAAQAYTTGGGVKVGILDHSFGTQLHPALYAGSRNFVEGNDEVPTTPGSLPPSCTSRSRGTSCLPASGAARKMGGSPTSTCSSTTTRSCSSTT